MNQREVHDALLAFTGMEDAVFVQSGTAALSLAIKVLYSGGQEISIPALACWAISAAVIHSGNIPRFVDVDRHLSSQAPSSEIPAAFVEPWGAPTNWKKLLNCNVPAFSIARSSLMQSWRDAAFINFSMLQCLASLGAAIPHGGGRTAQAITTATASCSQR
jgi:hypothetical protein